MDTIRQVGQAGPTVVIPNKFLTIMDMEVTGVTIQVFWIFLGHFSSLLILYRGIN